MSRIFMALTAFAVLMLVINIMLGLAGGDYNEVANRYRAAQQQLVQQQSHGQSPKQPDANQDQLRELGDQLEKLDKLHTTHFLLGLAASLVTVLVNCITVTYFIGTSRWCKEVVATYTLDDELAARSETLKRSTFPWSLIGIITVLTIIFLGGAALPFGRMAGQSASWVTPHLVSALAGTMLIAWSFVVQVGKIRENYELIQAILCEVHRVRASRGLNESSV